MSTKILVTSEIASGAINGVNKIFTTSKVISGVNSISVSGNYYAQYSFSGSNITLDDAPSSGSVLVTYSYESDYDYIDNSGWITGEVLQGTANGTNKVFNTFYPISAIDEIRINGTPTVAYTTTGNSILFSSPPASSAIIDIDYFRKDLGVIDYSYNRYYTKKEIRDLIYGKIGQDDTSVQYPVSLVDSAIGDGVVEIITQLPDKSRIISFGINSVGYVTISPKTTSISTFDVVKDKAIPPSGRLLSAIDGEMIDYTNIDSSSVITSSYYSRLPETNEKYFVGYKLPRNVRRIVGVTYDSGSLSQDAGYTSNFLFGNSYYFINNGYIYLKYNARYTIEVELNDNIMSSDDNSIVYIDKDDVGVIVYYALRQLYHERESDKIQEASQLYTDKLRSYKRRMRTKRSNDKSNKMRTSNGLIPS